MIYKEINEKLPRDLKNIIHSYSFDADKFDNVLNELNTIYEMYLILVNIKKISKGLKESDIFSFSYYYNNILDVHMIAYRVFNDDDFILYNIFNL
jgi:hypothetical protein